MITGVIFPSYLADATFEMVTGTEHADYPVQNLSDLKAITRVFRASASGAISFSFVLPADQTVSAFAMCRHNGVNGATWQVELYSDDALTAQVYDSTAMTLALDAGTLFAQTTPHTIDPVTIRGGVVTLSDIGKAWQLGGFEIGQLWDLSDASARSLGLKAQDAILELGDGATQGTRRFSPRAVTLGLDVIDWTTDGVTLQAFQWDRGLDGPFVFARDFTDPETFPREAILMRNSSLNDLNKDAWTIGSLSLSGIEHLG